MDGSLTNISPAKRYYRTHLELKRAYGRAYYYRNRERILEANRAKKRTQNNIVNQEIKNEESGYTLSFD
jgi:hypothetical protein